MSFDDRATAFSGSAGARTKRFVRFLGPARPGDLSRKRLIGAAGFAASVALIVAVLLG